MNSSAVYSNRMATVTGRSVVLLISLTEEISLGEDLTLVASLTSFGPIIDFISWMLTRCNIRTVGTPPRNITTFLWPVQDDLNFKALDIYSIPVSVISSTFDILGVPFRPGSGISTAPIGFIVCTNQPWLSTA
jgi:hypothetical protein